MKPALIWVEAPILTEVSKPGCAALLSSLWPHSSQLSCLFIPNQSISLLYSPWCGWHARSCLLLGFWCKLFCSPSIFLASVTDIVFICQSLFNPAPSQRDIPRWCYQDSTLAFVQLPCSLYVSIKRIQLRHTEHRVKDRVSFSWSEAQEWAMAWETIASTNIFRVGFKLFLTVSRTQRFPVQMIDRTLWINS